MKQFISCCTTFSLLLFSHSANCQARRTEDNTNLFTKIFKTQGKFWAMAYGDFTFKNHADSLTPGKGINNQYAGMPANAAQCQLRNLFIGYNYHINTHFTTELLLAADNAYSLPIMSTGGINLPTNQFTPYLKLANVKWNNIFPGTDLVAGKIYTPAFAGNSDASWGYRSIEKTVSEFYGTPASATGLALHGFHPQNDNLGYNIMVAQGLKQENNSHKWYYGNVFYKLFEQKLLIDLYADYTRLDNTPGWTHDRQMNKILISYSLLKFTIGAEAFTNRLRGDNIATRYNDSKTDTLTTRSAAVSLFVKGRLYRRTLGFFARYDNFIAGLNNNNAIYRTYSNLSPFYTPNTAQQFVTLGLDYTPIKNIKIMPNIWYAGYTNTGPANLGTANKGYDLVYRLSLSYAFGK